MRRPSCGSGSGVIGAAMSAALMVVLAAASASSQTKQAIKLVVPFPPAGGIDVLARILADEIGRTQGQAIVVENRPGAGTEIGSEVVVRAPPDGNTLLINNNAIVVMPNLRKVNFDPRTDLAAICNAASTPTVIVVESKSPYRSLLDFVADARARPGELTYGSAPAGVINVAFEMLARLGDFKVTFVPFGGTPPAVNALLGGHITAAFVDYPAAAGQLQAGKLRALATGSRERVKELPDVPTIAEQGFKDYELDIWYGLFAPAKTSNEVLSRVSGWIREALKAPTVRAKLAPQALDPVGTCGADFARYVGSEYDKFGRAIRELNIKP